MQFIHITTPQEEMWYAREPLVQITLGRDGTYSRFLADDGTFVQYDPKGKLTYSERYSPKDLQEMIGTLRRDLDFRKNLGLTKSDDIRWALLQENVPINGKITDLYELTMNVREQENTERRKFRVNVDKSTDLPIQREMYRQHWESRDWMLIATVRFVYPEQIPDEILDPKFLADD